VRDLVTRDFVPVWLNVRVEPLPALAPFDAVLGKTRLDEGRHVEDAASRGFFLRSLVLTPDGGALLNPQDATPEASMALYQEKGYFAYAQVKTEDYLPMLRAALAQWRRSVALGARGEAVSGWRP